MLLACRGVHGMQTETKHADGDTLCTGRHEKGERAFARLCPPACAQLGKKGPTCCCPPPPPREALQSASSVLPVYLAAFAQLLSHIS
eukprot:351660-Chlamydomonas_euryale.AAC.2